MDEVFNVPNLQFLCLILLHQRTRNPLCIVFVGKMMDICFLRFDFNLRLNSSLLSNKTALAACSIFVGCNYDKSKTFVVSGIQFAECLSSKFSRMSQFILRIVPQIC